MYTYLYIVSIRTNVACPRRPGTCSPTSFTLEEASCIRVFFLIEEQIHAHRERFPKEYGVVPAELMECLALPPEYAVQRLGPVPLWDKGEAVELCAVSRADGGGGRGS